MCTRPHHCCKERSCTVRCFSAFSISESNVALTNTDFAFDFDCNRYSKVADTQQYECDQDSIFRMKNSCLYEDNVQYTILKTGDKRANPCSYSSVETAFKIGSGVCLVAKKVCFPRQYADVTTVRLLNLGSEVLQMLLTSGDSSTITLTIFVIVKIASFLRMASISTRSRV